MIDSGYLVDCLIIDSNAMRLEKKCPVQSDFFFVLAETAMSTGGAPLLNGRVSRELKATAAAKGDKSPLSAVKLLSDFFTVCDPLANSTYQIFYVIYFFSKAERIVKVCFVSA